MSERCACQSGSAENGWHEERCQPCWQAELDLWSDMFTRCAPALERIRAERRSDD